MDSPTPKGIDCKACFLAFTKIILIRQQEKNRWKWYIQYIHGNGIFSSFFGGFVGFFGLFYFVFVGWFVWGLVCVFWGFFLLFVIVLVFKTSKIFAVMQVCLLDCLITTR